MAGNKITIITQPYCEWCTRVRELLKDYPHTIVDTSGQGGTSLRRFLEGQGIRQVPAVFVDGDYIGGYEDSKTWLREFHTSYTFGQELHKDG